MSQLIQREVTGRIATGFLASLLMVVGVSSSDDLTARGLFVKNKADAIRVRIVDDKSDTAVLPDQEFKKNDKLRIEITTNFDAYLYIVNREISDDRTTTFLVFPNAGAANNMMKEGGTKTLFSTFDQRPAVETLEVIVSRQPLEPLETALKRSQCKSEDRCQLEPETNNVLTQLLGIAKSSPLQKNGGVFPANHGQPKEGFSRARDIILSPGKDKEDENSYVAIKTDGNAEGRLESGQVIAFQIRLKHI